MRLVAYSFEDVSIRILVINNEENCYNPIFLFYANVKLKVSHVILEILFVFVYKIGIWCNYGDIFSADCVHHGFAIL